MTETKLCKLCKEPFDLTEGEIEFYNSKQWPVPAKCPMCRRIEKAIKAEVVREVERQLNKQNA